jgi:hypothetical protein
MMLLLLLSAPVFMAQDSQPFGVVALAGRTHPEARSCECGTQDCLCDPEELTVQKNAGQESGPVNLGAAFSLLVGAAFLVLRLRQI